MAATRTVSITRSGTSSVRWLALSMVVAMVLVACGAGQPAFDGPEDLEGLDPDEICELLAEAERPETMTEEAFDELIAAFALMCAQLGVPLPPSGAPSNGGAGVGGAAPGAEDRDGDRADQRGNGTRTDSDLIGADPFDDDVRRRAIEAGPQCDMAEVDLSMSEVMKAPAIGPMGSPPFDAELAKEQYRAPALCLPEPYRSEWLVVAAAYEPMFDLLEAYAAASNQGFEALVGLGERIAEIEPQLAALESDEVRSATASTQAFFEELRATGDWDEYETASPWGRWWEGEAFQQLWLETQRDAARGGVQLPDIPSVP